MSWSSSPAARRAVDVAAPQHDVDVCGEQPGPEDRTFRLAKRTTDHRRCRVQSTTRQVEQCEAGLGLVPVRVGASVGGLGRVEVAEEAQKIRLKTQCRAEDRRDGIGEPAARVACRFEAVAPSAEYTKHLRRMHEAVPAIQDELLMQVAPLLHRRCPGPAPDYLGQLGARVDDRAVRVTGRGGRQLSSLDRYHRFVEQREPIGVVAQVDQHSSLADTRQRDELPIAEACTELASLLEMSSRAGEVAVLEDPDHPERVLEIALLDTVDLRLLEQPSGAVDPAAGTRDVALETEALGEADTEVRAAVDGTVLRAPQVGARPQREPDLVAPGQVRRGRIRVEVVDLEIVDGDLGEGAPGITPAPFITRGAGRRKYWLHGESLVDLDGQAKNVSATSGSTPKNIHISAMRSPSKR